MIKFHPHYGGINATIEPIWEIETIGEFVSVVQREVSDIRHITKDDITFHRSGTNPSQCSDAFKAFAAHVGWPEIYAVSVGKLVGGRPVIVPVGYSDQAFGPWVG